MHASSILILGLFGLQIDKAQTQSESFNYGWVTTIRTTTEIFYAPNPGYDPYWIGGQWVFGTTHAPSTGTTEEVVRLTAEDRVLVCGRACGRIYRKLIGEVCVHKLDNVYDPRYTGEWKDAPVKGFIDWRLGGVLDRTYDYMRTFSSYCEFLDTQCRTRIFHGVGYVFLHMGKCLRDDYVFPNLMYGGAIRDRKKAAVSNYAEEMRYKTDGKQHFLWHFN